MKNLLNITLGIILYCFFSDTAFGQRAFLHVASASNTEQGYITFIDDEYINGRPGKLLFVSEHYRGSVGYSNRQVGVYYNGQKGKWSIYTEDKSAIPAGATFSILEIMPSKFAFKHIATKANTIGNMTTIDFPSVPIHVGIEGEVLIVTQLWEYKYNRSQHYNNSAIGVRYDASKKKWTIFNQDKSPIKPGRVFNVLRANLNYDFLPNAKAYNRPVYANNPYGYYQYLDESNSNVHVFTTARMYNDRLYNPHVEGVWYDRSKKQWAVYNKDKAQFPSVKVPWQKETANQYPSFNILAIGTTKRFENLGCSHEYFSHKVHETNLKVFRGLQMSRLNNGAVNELETAIICVRAGTYSNMGVWFNRSVAEQPKIIHTNNTTFNPSPSLEKPAFNEKNTLIKKTKKIDGAEWYIYQTNVAIRGGHHLVVAQPSDKAFRYTFTAEDMQVTHRNYIGRINDKRLKADTKIHATLCLNKHQKHDVEKYKNPTKYKVYYDKIGKYWVMENADYVKIEPGVELNIIINDCKQSEWTNGQAADQVLGQPDLVSNTANNGGVSASTLDGCSGIAIDFTNGKMYVVDEDNHRVLRYSYPITSNQQAAELVFGQADFTSNSTSTAANTMREPSGVAVDNTGRLWVGDSHNNRVLWFNTAHSISSNGPDADGVLGQVNFTSRISGVSTMTNVKGIAIDNSGTLWVADANNNRVLRFDNASSLSGKTKADGVLGQGNLTSNQTNRGGFSTPAVNSMWSPYGVYIQSNGTLWVADRDNNRVLRFDNASSKLDGANADGVLGQADFTFRHPNRSGSTAANSMYLPNGVTVNGNGRLYVTDEVNERVLIFNDAANKMNGADADNVLGQSSFIVNSRGTTASAMNLGVRSAMTVDINNDYLWLSDTENNRVIRFSAPQK